MILNEEKQQEIANTRLNQTSTFRPVVTELEEILYKPLPVLDHGFVRVIDYMGDDNAVVQAARVSYGRGTKKVNEDQGLINYLMRHSHSTPFEMCEIKFHIKLPIFVARQWIRHRTANVNEYSARYSILAKEFYIPRPENIASQAASNRQGRDQDSISAEEAEKVISILKSDAELCYSHYQELLNMDEYGNIIDPNKNNIARELARINLGVNFYTEWYWKIDLHNLLHFLRLRADPHAQYEIKVYAEIMLDIVKKWAPLTYQAFEEYKMNGAYISNKGLKIIKSMIKGQNSKREDFAMSKREWDELMAILQDE